MNHKLPDRQPAALDFEELVARCMGNLDFVERVLTKFQYRFTEDLALLEKRLGEEDTEAVAHIAHRLKGSSANVAASGLREQAAQIERLGRARRIEEIPPCLEQLRSEWARFLESLPALGSRPGAAC